MKKISYGMVIGLACVLSGCATVSQYQQECERQFPKYSDSFTCTKNKIYDDPRASNPQNAAEVNELIAYGTMLDEKVRKKKMSDSEAKYLLSVKVTELKHRQVTGPTSWGAPQSTTCTNIGGVMNCSSIK